MAGTRLVVTLGVALATFSSCSSVRSRPEARERHPAPPGFSLARLQRLDDRIQRHLQRKELAGAVVFLWRRGTRILRTYGHLDGALRKPMRADAIFRIASMTKLLTTVAALGLYEEGRLLEMLLRGGELDGVRLLSPKTVELMLANQLSGIGETFGPGHGFGLGGGVVTDLGRSGSLGSQGQFYWAGSLNTSFWLDRRERMFGVLLTQVRPFGHLDPMELVQLFAYQAIVTVDRAVAEPPPPRAQGDSGSAVGAVPRAPKAAATPP